MAQTQKIAPINTTALQYASNAEVSVGGTGNTSLMNIPVRGLSRIFVQLAVTTQALDAFLIKGKASPDATAVTIFSQATDFTSPAGLMVDASGDLTALAASGSGWFAMDVSGLESVEILASAAADSAVVTIHAGGY